MVATVSPLYRLAFTTWQAQQNKASEPCCKSLKQLLSITGICFKAEVGLSPKGSADILKDEVGHGASMPQPCGSYNQWLRTTSSQLCSQWTLPEVLGDRPVCSHLPFLPSTLTPEWWLLERLKIQTGSELGILPEFLSKNHYKTAHP